MISKLFDNKKYVIFGVTLLLLNIILALCLCYNKYTYVNLINKKCLLLILLVNVIYFISFFIFYKLKGHELKIEKLYLYMIIPIGMLYLVGIPFGSVPDEGVHFKRAYEISNGDLVSHRLSDGRVGNELDSNIDLIYMDKHYYELIDMFNIKSSGKLTEQWFDNVALYSFVCYIPQTLGILVGKVLNLSLIMQAYLGRICNFILFIILGYFSIKLIPVKKNFVFFISFLPIVLQEAVSLSADSMTISVSIFLICYIVYLKNSKKKITNLNLFILLISSIVLSLCKIVYLPLVFLVFLIPKNKFISVKSKYIWLSIIILICVFLNLYWLSISSTFLPDNDNINSSLQLKNILGNPIKYIYVIANTYMGHFGSYLGQALGKNLGPQVIHFTDIYYIPLLLIFSLHLIFDSSSKKIFTINEKIYIGIILVGIILLISTSLYLQWTPLNNKSIEGIQGRYFIPLFIPLSLLISNFKLNNYDKFLKYSYLFIVAINLIAMTTTYFYFL